MKKTICVVPGCDSIDTQNDSVKFHQIPKEADVRKKWLKAINRTEAEINKKCRVCSKHFKPHDYAITKLNYTMGGKSTASSSKNTCEFKALKTEAVPNQCLPQKSTFKIKISKKDNTKQIKVEEVKVKEEKIEKPEKVKMPKRPAPPDSPPRSRTQSRRAASKEALKQMQLLLDDENDAVEIPDDDAIPIDPTPPVPPPPKKKYKLSHRKSSDGNVDREVLVLKTITNRDAENTLELECWVEQLEQVQRDRIQKLQDEEKEVQAKLESLISQGNGKIIHKGDLNTVIEVTEQVQSAIKGSQQSYQLVVDPRMSLIVGAQSSSPSQKMYQGKVQVAQNLQQTPTTSSNQPTSRVATRTRGRGSTNKITPPPPVVTPTRSKSSTQTIPQIQSTPQTRGQGNQGRVQSQIVLPSRQVQTGTTQTRAQAQVGTTQTRAQAQVGTPQTRGKTGIMPAGKKITVVTANAPVTRAKGPSGTTFTTSVRPSETNVEGGLTTGSTGTQGSKKVVVDLTSDDSRSSAPDSREISFNKLQGKTYPSLVVVARPHLRVQDLSLDRPKLDAKVKSVLMHIPTKFTEWLIQQGLIRSEQKCSVHTNTQLKLGMYSDVSKFPYSGGYVWISECCPQRFVSVFSGSLFEGSPHPPMVILKLLYHWACQTNIQNVTQWVKVDNLYVKGMFTWLRSICTVALQTHVRQIGGPGIKVEVGVISLGTTTQDGNQRQVKVEVLGVLESESKLIRLRAVEPQVEGDRNYKKRFSKILEPLIQWVHPQSILVADLTVDKQTLIGMGFTNVAHYSSNQYGNNNQIMDYLRRIVPRMFQNTLSLLSRQIIQQFLDELVWREWFGTSSLQAFDNLIIHLAEQTRFDSGMSLIVRLNKVAQNPFKSWNVNINVPPKVIENTKKSRNTRKPDPPKVTQPVAQEINRPPKSTSPDVPEQMVPLENYYYGTIDTYSKTPKITLNMKCPFCKSVFDNNIQLMSHLFKHAHNVSMDAQLCRYCLTSVATANDLLKHIATSHPAETKFDNGFCCLVCETQYMNPFVLGKHMSKEHCPSELPYQCGTCGYRCSNHKQAIDHFYRTHDNGPTIQCPFCLKSTTVFTSSRNIVQNMNYFIQHLQKHQRKQFARRCGKCNLWFVQKDVLKEHQNRMHVSQRGKPGLVPWNAPRNGVMVPKSKMDKYPVDAEVINFATLKFDLGKGLMCKECNTPMDTPKHFPSFESCQNPNCQYSTCCTNAMQEHNAKCSKTNNPVAEEQLPFEMYCICNFSDTDGNKMARHLAICERKSAYPSKSEAQSAIVTHSMLDVLGLVRKPEENPKPKPKLDKNKTKNNDDNKIKNAEIDSFKDEDLNKTENVEVDALRDDDDNKTEDAEVDAFKDDDVVMIEKSDKDVLKNDESTEEGKNKHNGTNINKNKNSEEQSDDFIQESTKKSETFAEAMDDNEGNKSELETSKELEENQMEYTEKVSEETNKETEENSAQIEGIQNEIEKQKCEDMQLAETQDDEEISSEIDETAKDNKENEEIEPENEQLYKEKEGNDVETTEKDDREDISDGYDEQDKTKDKDDDGGDKDDLKNVNNVHIEDKEESRDNDYLGDKEDIEDAHEESEDVRDEGQDSRGDSRDAPEEEIQDIAEDSQDLRDENKDEEQHDIRSGSPDIREETQDISEETKDIPEENREFSDDSPDVLEESREISEDIQEFGEESRDNREEIQDIHKEHQVFGKDSTNNREESEDIHEDNQGIHIQSREEPKDTPQETLDICEESQENRVNTPITCEETPINEESPDIHEESESITEESQDKDYGHSEENIKESNEFEDLSEKEDEVTESENDTVVAEKEQMEEENEVETKIEQVKEPSRDIENTSNYSEEVENKMETSETRQEKEATITSDDIQSLLSDVVGDTAMETEIEAKRPEDIVMTSPTEMMDSIQDGSQDLPTPMETD